MLILNDSCWPLKRFLTKDGQRWSSNWVHVCFSRWRDPSNYWIIMKQLEEISELFERILEVSFSKKDSHGCLQMLIPDHWSSFSLLWTEDHFVDKTRHFLLITTSCWFLQLPLGDHLAAFISIPRHHPRTLCACGSCALLACFLLQKQGFRLLHALLFPRYPPSFPAPHVPWISYCLLFVLPSLSCLPFPFLSPSTSYLRRPSTGTFPTSRSIPVDLPKAWRHFVMI